MTSSVPFGLVLGALALGGGAVADPVSTTSSPQYGTERRTVVMPATAFTPHVGVSPVLYLNRCMGGCVVHGGTINDARTQSSAIPPPGDYNIGAFANPDADWQGIVQCMKEVYSPYNVMVTDVQPTSGSYHEAIIAGLPSDIGEGGGVLGIAPLSGDCSAVDNVISFSFANAHAPTQFVYNVCWTAAQESAHAYGLDHEYSFVDGYDKGSACNDPMTYRTDCGGEKFFRNHNAQCGEFVMRPSCRCSPTQNSHLKQLAVHGPGTPITTPPVVTELSPADGATIGNGVTVQVQGSAQRGIDHLDLYLNGFKWGDPTPGAVFGSVGQPQTTYTLPIPMGVPDSIIDIVVKAYDDLGAETDTAMVTVTKGAPCVTADTCAVGQMCETGRCFWPPPSGQIGDTCTYDQFCVSLECSPTQTDKICTQSCIPGSSDSCPMGYDCLQTSPGNGFCYFPQGGGCCSSGHETGGAILVHLGFGVFVLGIVLRRRRR